MTQAQEIIKGALRESNLIALTAAPNALQQTEALTKLNRLISSVFGYEAGTKLFDFPIGNEGTEDYVVSWTSAEWQYPPPNVRLLVTDQVAQTIYLPPFPDNGARVALVDLKGNMATYPITLHASGKKIEDAAFLVVNQDDANLEWMYRADLGNWVRLTLLELDDPLPFPLQFDDFFETSLAMRLNPRYGRSITKETAAVLDRAMSQMRSTYRQKRSVRAPEAVLRMSDTGRTGFSDEIPAPRSNVWMQ